MTQPNQDNTPTIDLLGGVEGISAGKATVIAEAFPTRAELGSATQAALTALEGIGAATARKALHAAVAIDQATPIEALEHLERRTNIPSDEHAHLVEADQPETLLYPRDPDLDPQLVWRGKDSLDAEPLSVPVVPIYIQERIVPQAIVENLRHTAGNEEDEPELTLFDDFDGIDDPIAAIEAYRHDMNWANRLILGDALVAMTSLAEKENLKGKVQTVYIDPPYGIKFNSNWQISTNKRAVADGKDITPQPEQIRAFRDTWKDGINSYLTYLRDRLTAARTLLTESGSVFVQISDDNLHVVRSLLDEVFGPSNYVSTITFHKTAGASSAGLATIADFILWYARDHTKMKYRQMYKSQRLGGDGVSGYRKARLPDGSSRNLTKVELAGIEPVQDEEMVFQLTPMTSQRPPGDFPIELDGKTYRPGKGYWKTGQEGVERLRLANRLAAAGNTLRYVRFLDDFGVYPIHNVWADTHTAGFAANKTYVVQTNPTAIERCVLMTSDPGDLVLDPTCGSGTTAVVAEKWGRRWIAIDTSRVAITLARQRIMGTRYPYYLLADSEAGASAEALESGQPAPAGVVYAGDIRRGFVYKRALHIMLSTISRCEEIVPGMSQEEADAAIRRAADYEMLFDQPHEDPKTVRVAGHFTVESLSPHRTLAPFSGNGADSGDYVEMVLDNLQRSGVQNGYRDQRLEFGSLEPFPGTWVHAIGAFTTSDGESQTIAVTVGPEAGTVGRETIAEAAKEAVRDARADLLLICAYAFDAGATEQATNETDRDHNFTIDGQLQVGRLRVLNARINTDLMMADDLKNTGAGNLFTVFGEPDITTSQLDDGTLKVTLNGLDIYDPNTAELRSSEPTDIACWFIDTNYNSDAFFVRHAYFTGGASDPYQALKSALKAEINPEAWGALYRTESLPFATPETGKIAVKAINHYGDEALKVFEV